MALHFLVESSTGAGVGDVVSLTGAEAKHAAVVRRLRVGEAVTVGDGAGVWLTGVAEEVSPTRVEVRIAERTEHPAPAPRIVLVQALAKGDRDELAVQAACELGVDEIVPWQASRSVSRWEGPKAVKGRERWATIVREAAKQAHRAWVPTVSAPISTAELTARTASHRVLLLDPSAPTRLSELEPDGRDIVLVVGPEGGISDHELAMLSDAGAERVLLGSTVLRTSTAGPAAIAVLSVALARW
ncbi:MULTISPECIES: 16S rRNA (uracil(1498)-N(3))-methyltransferase [unclassified Microbacterium]|uniref:16S rRNA (uracil(1498)-N(3))-methyltransferase n=1 Tax=unclassified Microbacterium TaxID=2609290 RepID=UPI000CFC1D18|nr:MULTISPECIES: 16S rRNA (uracil(1498)-N(3))-methyltransferase [unclassified Microbacterium]PQZ60602.1 16S rRNA (uracil(1498)-N(3))-methyltransferase [Microbacterium sp. MYb43]PQZ82028.1 16S rRNA (uracil(1498)-N(3))-methyltransferase [Microbacterium sp. MYb40]PRB22291.1 16S rRNA (uracil(1498)-N(3))-methyltransferase [Microbacterium sp. MYb54]PRB31144.1 16S rRNA (uracil(1498)-N(3))-methyltransferase [Microbacterium sp. MYb50]PRB69753.1 16S rRNA (uracil(1498)-N(3))-methyltransferase [Microbacte